MAVLVACGNSICGNSAIAAVNEGQIFRFLNKPCPPAVLLKTIETMAETPFTTDEIDRAKLRSQRISEQLMTSAAAMAC